MKMPNPPVDGLLVFRDASAPRLKRNVVQRSKNGCFACKARRMKCDEAKPVCLYCAKKDPSKCVWPEAPLKTKHPPIRATSTLNVTKPNLHQLQKTRFSSPREYQYFNFFREQTAIALSGNFTDGVWGELMLQASETDKAIRHAIIAVGALDASEHAAKQVGSQKTHSGIVKPEFHHHFALQQYSNAIKCLIEAVSAKRQSTPLIIIACALTTCFEIYNTSYEVAYLQVCTALKLLADWKHRQGSGSKKAREAFADEFVDIFGRLEIMILSWISDPSVIFKKYGTIDPGYGDIPETFESIAEARHYWSDYFARRPLRPNQVTAGHSDEVCYSKLEQTSKNINENNPEIVYALVAPLRLPNRLRTTQVPVWHMEPHDLGHLDLLGDLKNWKHAFEPLYERSQTPARKKDYIAALSLQITSLYFHIMLSVVETVRENAPSLLGVEMLFDNYNAIFAQIVKLCKTLLTHPEMKMPKTAFSFDYQIVVSLHFVGRKCRHPVIRREAIGLMCAANRREGLWDMFLSGKVTEWMMEVEEMGMEDGLVPEWSRLTGLGCSFERNLFECNKRYALEKRTVWLSCVKPKRDPSEETVILKKEIEW